jgi:hypothetical protein
VPDMQAIHPADLSRINRSLRDLEVLQVQLKGTVDEVSATSSATRNELSDLRAAFDDFLRRDLLAKNLQLAQTEIISVRQEIETSFGHYGVVRRQATGVLQAMDAGIVTHGTIQSTSEELMLSSPRYWLAPALVALAAWVRDNRSPAEKGLAEALRRDNDKTALFFALVLRRHNRDFATARWIQQYIVRQDPAALPKEFAVVLDAVATGALGLAAKPVLTEHMADWHARLAADEETVEAQVRRWMQLIDGMRRPVDPRITILPNVSPTWPALKDLYEGATVQGRAEEHFRELFDGPVVLSHDLRKRVDDVLNSLVTNFDEEEAPLRRKEAELQSVIDNHGDRVAADTATAAAASTHDTTTDFLTLLTNAAFFPERMGTSAGTQRMAIALARDWIIQAGGRLEAKNLNAMPPCVELAIEGWHGRIDASSSEPQLVAGLTQHIDRQTEDAMAAVRFTGPPLVAAVIGGLLLLVCIFLLASGGTGGAVFFLLCAGGLGGWAGYEYQQIPARREQIKLAGEARKLQGVAHLRGAVAETIDLRTQWSREIGRAGDFRALMDGLNSQAFVERAPDLARGVMA